MGYGAGSRRWNGKKKKYHVTEEERKLAIGVCVFFLGAVFIGAVLANVMKSGEGGVFSGGLQGIAQEKTLTFSAVYLKYAKYAFLIWLGGWIPLGLVCSGVTVFFRGMFLGFTTGFLIRGYGMRGVFVILSSCFLQNLILIPLYLFLTWCAILFFMDQRKPKTGKSGLQREKQKRRIEYTVIFLGGMLGIFFVSGLEMILAPVLWQVIG